MRRFRALELKRADWTHAEDVWPEGGRPVQGHPSEATGPGSLSRWPALALALLLTALGPGCTLVRETADLPFRAAELLIPGVRRPAEVDPVELQEQLLRFGV